MRKGIIWTVLSIIVVLICTTVVLVYGARREKSGLAHLQHILDLQLQSELSKTVALPSFLASHSLVLSGLHTKQASPELHAFLAQFVLQTGQFSIVIADETGLIIAGGMRNPDAQILPEMLSSSSLIKLQTGTLSRRILPEKGSSGSFEVGLSVRQQGRGIIGYIVVSDALEDFAINWRSMPDRLILQSLEGEVLFATTPFSSATLGILKVSSTSLRNSLILSLERRPSALLPYAVAGLGVGILWMMAVFFGAVVLQNRRQLVRLHISSLTRDAALLEKRVAERTQRLTAEIKQRKIAETTLREKQAQLIQADKFKVIGDMAAGLSHELSQPLFALQTSLSTLERQLRRVTGPAPVTLQKTQRFADRMERLLHNLRSFARNETEDLVPVNAQKTVNAALEILAAPLKQSNVEVNQIPQVSTMMLLAGSVRLQQVIVNVVSNALDAIAANDTGTIQISYVETTSNGRIYILDNGPGFHALDKAAVPFFTTKGDQHGLGLGLSISSDIMKGFGGSLILRNNPNGGAEVILTLPLIQKALTH